MPKKLSAIAIAAVLAVFLAAGAGEGMVDIWV